MKQTRITIEKIKYNIERMKNMKKTVTKILGLLIAIILISQHLQVFAVTAEQKQLEQEKSENEDMIK